MAEKNMQEELDLEKKVTVKNIAGWNVGFARRVDGFGDVTISPNGSIKLSRNEIIAQIQNGNKLFSGVDGHGSHATLYIDDAPTRLEVEFDTDSTLQNVLAHVNLKTLFSSKLSQVEFESKFREAVHTRAEKYAIMEQMRKAGINEYTKIRFAEQYTGYKFQ